MTKPADRPDSKIHAMISGLEARIAASAISTILVAVAGAITLVAVAYAIYAGLRDPLSPAGASAVTALIFAIVTAALAVVGPKLIKARASAAKTEVAAPRPAIDPSTMRTALEIGLAVVATLADVAWQRRRNKR